MKEERKPSKRNHHFKVLMHCGQYIDIGKLDKGIYAQAMPRLYDSDETMSGIVEEWKLYKHIIGDTINFTAFFENLEKCELISIELVFEINN